MFLVPFQRFLIRERGAAAIQYVLLASSIAAVIIAIINTMGLELTGLIEGLKNAF